MLTTFDRVQNVLLDALNAEKSDVTPDASLSGDLGAESIDLLQIVFELEQEFDIKIDSAKLFPTGIFKGDEGYVENGRVTEKGMKKLKEVIPFGDFSKLDVSPLAGEVTNVFTVDTLVKFIDSSKV